MCKILRLFKFTVDPCAMVNGFERFTAITVTIKEIMK
jgi:hypothetical protein